MAPSGISRGGEHTRQFNMPLQGLQEDVYCLKKEQMIICLHSAAFIILHITLVGWLKPIICFLFFFFCSLVSPAGDVKEFGFRQIPDDGNYASHFSADLSTPKAASAEDSNTAFSESRPAAESDLIDLGEGKQTVNAGQGDWNGDQQAVEQAIQGDLVKVIYRQHATTSVQ